MSNPTTRGPAAAQHPWADPPHEPLTAEEIARATDAVNFALVAFGVPERFRLYIDALIGASGGSMDWFEAADIEIGQRARQATAQKLKDQSIAKWTQRQREDFNQEWQLPYKITLVETMPGGKVDGQYYKTRYRIAGVFHVAIETDKQARVMPFFEKQPKRALRKAAAAVYLEFQDKLSELPKRQRFRRPRPTCETYLKLINTYVEKLCGQAIIENQDLGQLLQPILLNIQGKCELLINSLAHFSNRTQTQQDQTDAQGVKVDKMSIGEKGAGSEFVHTLHEEKAYGQETARRGVL
jgi:hypothetical protein